MLFVVWSKTEYMGGGCKLKTSSSVFAERLQLVTLLSTQYTHTWLRVGSALQRQQATSRKRMPPNKGANHRYRLNSPKPEMVPVLSCPLALKLKGEVILWCLWVMEWSPGQRFEELCVEMRKILAHWRKCTNYGPCAAPRNSEAAPCLLQFQLVAPQ